MNKINSSKVRIEFLKQLNPITQAQGKVFQTYSEGANLCLNGSAGTGKTYIGLYLALQDVLDKNTQYNKVVIVRSIVPTRDIGFLPGTEEEKKEAYTLPYKTIIKDLVEVDDAWNKLINQDALEFMSTSFIRGITISNAIVLVDEMQNLNFHELDSVITRLGENCRIILCGDYFQSDFERDKDRAGIKTFLGIIKQMKSFEIIEFGWEDIVRSGLVRDYIMTKQFMGIDTNGKVQKV